MGQPKRLRDEKLNQKEKQELTTLLEKMSLLPNAPCQITFHCSDSKVQAVEARIKL